MSGTLLLDTCAVIWLGNGIPLRSNAADVLANTTKTLFSPISLWEIGLLSRTRTRTDGLTFLPDVKTWVTRMIGRPTIGEQPITNDIAWDAANLPGDFHSDPADRFIVATARVVGAAILTRDRKILQYAADGWVKAVPC